MPPSWPAITMCSALALATPAAIVPTPASATSLTEISASGFTHSQVVDQLGEILDRVDVVVRRRGDQADAGRRVAQAGDRLVDLVARQLAALAGLGALGDLDLELVGVDQVGGRHAEPRRRDLLDRRAAQIAVSVGHRAARDPRRPRRCSSGRRAGSSRSRASRAPRARSSRGSSRRSRTGARSPPTARPARAGSARRRRPARAARAASRAGPSARRPRPRSRGTSRSSRRARRAAGARPARAPTRGARRPAVAVLAAGLEAGPRACEGGRVARRGRRVQLGESDAAEARHRAREVALDERGAQPDGLEDLRAAVALDGRDAHLRAHLEQAARTIAVDDSARRGRRRAGASRARGRGTRPPRRSRAGARSASSRAARPTRRPGRTSCGRPRARGASGRRRSRAGRASAPACASTPRSDRTRIDAPVPYGPRGRPAERVDRPLHPGGALGDRIQRRERDRREAVAADARSRSSSRAGQHGVRHRPPAGSARAARRAGSRSRRSTCAGSSRAPRAGGRSPGS